jgi:hypothetical protein
MEEEEALVQDEDNVKASNKVNQPDGKKNSSVNILVQWQTMQPCGESSLLGLKTLIIGVRSVYAS